ncbi:MAG: LysM peptidoglycan-binding domain-containing protein [Phycisphaerales bacterium]|nr:LysM peptidoglycan-binding domain-containing protein [Phycisphaerales bacterium]
MNSGLRLTVALLLVAFISIGFYFASLEDADRSEEASITRDPVSEVDTVSEPGPLADPEPVSESTPTRDRSDAADTEDREPVPVDEPVVVRDSTDEATDASTPATEPRADDDVTAVVMDDMTGDPDASDTDDTPGSIIDPATGPDLGPDAETTVDAMTESRSPAYGRSQGVRASGIYLLKAVSPEDSAIDFEAARAGLVASVDPRPAGPEGTAWVPIADWCRVDGDGALQGIVTGMRTEPNGDRQFLLVRDDDAFGLRLDGRILGAEVVENSEGRPRVRFLLEDDAVREIQSASFPMVGGAVAWIVDGEAVSMPTLEIAVSSRGWIRDRFDFEQARWIAARLRGELMRRPGTPDPAELEAADDEDRATTNPIDLAGRSAAELPASAYTDYTIQAGDSFEGIATDWFGDPRKQSLIAIANPTVDPTRLQIGQVIKLPPKDTLRSIERSSPTETGVVIHVVRSGETLSDIAVEYLGKASRWQEIHEANLDVIGDDPARLTVGMELRIP